MRSPLVITTVFNDKLFIYEQAKAGIVAVSMGQPTNTAIANRRYAVGYCYAFKATTTIEHSIIKSFYTAWNYNACKTATITKYIITQPCYAVGYRYVRKFTATVKRRIADALYTLRYVYICKIDTTFECRVAYIW